MLVFTITSERGEGVKGEVKNISLHWLQGIFETVPNTVTAVKRYTADFHSCMQLQKYTARISKPTHFNVI